MLIVSHLVMNLQIVFSLFFSFEVRVMIERNHLTIAFDQGRSKEKISPT